MNNKKRSAAASAVAVIAVAALIGAGTFALFSDQKSVNDNTIAAGTVELRLTADGAAESAATRINATNQAPRPAQSVHQGNIDGINWAGTTNPNRVAQRAYRLSNVGSITSTLSFTLADVESRDAAGNSDPTMQDHIYVSLGEKDDSTATTKCHPSGWPETLTAADGSGDTWTIGEFHPIGDVAGREWLFATNPLAPYVEANQNAACLRIVALFPGFDGTGPDGKHSNDVQGHSLTWNSVFDLVQAN